MKMKNVNSEHFGDVVLSRVDKKIFENLLSNIVITYDTKSTQTNSFLLGKIIREKEKYQY